MKKLLVYVAFVCGLCSCGIDNYDKPTATLKGSIVDKETQECVPGQAQNGTKIRMYEFYNNEWAVQPNDSWVSQDGTFINSAVFAGKYKITAEGPFEEVTPIEKEVSGTTELKIEVTPFLRISAEAISNEAGKVTVNAKVENAQKRVITELKFFYGTTPYVDKNTSAGKFDQKLDESANQGTTTYTHTFDGLKSGKTYFFRVGGLAVNPGGYYNYSKVIEVAVK